MNNFSPFKKVLLAIFCLTSVSGLLYLLNLNFYGSRADITEEEPVLKDFSVREPIINDPPVNADDNFPQYDPNPPEEVSDDVPIEVPPGYFDEDDQLTDKPAEENESETPTIPDQENVSANSENASNESSTKTSPKEPATENSSSSEILPKTPPSKQEAAAASAGGSPPPTPPLPFTSVNRPRIALQPLAAPSPPGTTAIIGAYSLAENTVVKQLTLLVNGAVTTADSQTFESITVLSQALYPFLFHFNSSSMPPDTYPLMVRVTDAADRVGESNSVLLHLRPPVQVQNSFLNSLFSTSKGTGPLK